MIGLRSPSTNDQQRQNNDISRLLDPSYSSSYYRPAQQRATYGAYVDAHGDMHDPDYRHFPIIHPSSRSHRYASNGFDDDSALLLDEEDDVHDDLGFSYTNKRNSFSSTRTKTRPQNQFHYPSTRRSNSPTYSPVSKYASSGAILTSGVSPISTIASSSASSSSSMLSRSQTPVDSDESSKQRCRISALTKKRRRTSATTLDRERDDERAKVPKCLSYDLEDVVESQRRRSLEYAREEPQQQRNRFVEDVVEEEHEQQDDEEEDRRRQRRKEDSVPTCAESLRRQWQALSLRIRFGMFRAERQIKKRVQSLI